jgi:hypothetical protein
MICALKHHLGRRIEHIPIVGGNHDRLRPTKAKLHVFGAVARVIDRPDADVLCLHGALIPTCHDSVPGTGIHNVKISRVGYDVTALTSPNVVPVLAPDVPIVGAACNCDSAVVLLCAIDVIEELVVGSYVIELCGWLIFLGRCH